MIALLREEMWALVKKLAEPTESMERALKRHDDWLTVVTYAREIERLGRQIRRAAEEAREKACRRYDVSKD